MWCLEIWEKVGSWSMGEHWRWSSKAWELPVAAEQYVERWISSQGRQKLSRQSSSCSIRRRYGRQGGKHTSSTTFSCPLSSTSHFQPISRLVYRRLLPMSRLSKCALPAAMLIDVCLSKRLLSKRPRYVVLARTATDTIVYMGWTVARLDMACNVGSTRRRIQLGLPVEGAWSAPRHDAGRK